MPFDNEVCVCGHTFADHDENDMCELCRCNEAQLPRGEVEE